MEQGSECVVFFTVETEREVQVARFSPTTSPLELKELLRAAAEAGPRDILKLVSWCGQLVDISAALVGSTRHRPYHLSVVAAPTQGMLLSGTKVDLLSLEERVTRLEEQLHAECGHMPPSIADLKTRVDDLRVKLETTEHLSWLGFYKSCATPLYTDSCRSIQHRNNSDPRKQKVRERFLNICDVTISEDVRQRLRQPSFDCCQWEDEEVLVLLQQMFLDLDLLNKFNIDLTVLRNFLFEVYNNYNDIPFHNFRHCFCVAQMMYAITWCVDLPGKIGDLEALILLTSCICHDLDHPGYNNIYQINARTELALRYNDISPLENHHCSVAFRILERPEMNIFQSLHGETYRQVREGIIRCILATDMARHNEILAQFKDITPEFDYSNKAHVNLLSMVLIKVADISNEARPMDVAEPWLDRLLQEFFMQSDAEKLEGLPVTPFMDRDKITKPSSQCSFIGFVLLPLFEALGELLGDLQAMIVQPVRDALDYYRRLNDAAKDERSHRRSVVEGSSSDSMATCGGSLAQSSSAHSVRSRRSLPALLLRAHSRSTDGEDIVREGSAATPAAPASVEELLEEVEDEATATEVEVSEKALKFKISTEGSIGSGRKSYPGSRKGSRDKALSHDSHLHDLARAIRDKDREYRRADSAKEYGRVSSTSPVSSQGEAEGLLEGSATGHKDICNGGAEGICSVCRTARHDTRAQQVLVREDKELREQVSETVVCCLDSCRGCGDYRSDSIYDHNSEGGPSTLCSSDSPRDSLPKSPSSNQHHKSSILSRIRNFADRISFSSTNDKDGEGKSKHNHLLKSPSISAHSSPTTLKHDRRLCKAQSSNRGEYPSTSSMIAIPQPEDGSKAMTLPKTKQSQRQNGGHRGWRLFLSASKSDIPSSSLELVSEVRSPPNGKRQVLRSKRASLKGGSEELVSGSLDSVLQAKSTVGVSRKQGTSTASGVGSKHSVLLARMGRSGSEDSSCTSPQTQHAHGWMASLASSLRQRKSSDQE